MGSQLRHLHVGRKDRCFYGKRDRKWYMTLVGRLKGFNRIEEVVLLGDYRQTGILFLRFVQKVHLRRVFI